MSQGISLLLTLTPIATILVMLIFLRKPADFTGLIGWAVVALIAFFFYHTSWEVILRSTLGGFISSFPVSLIVAASLLQITLMEKTGALKRVIIFIKTISTENQAVSIMIINIGFGILLVSVGATPVSILPPILLALGYSTYKAIALPAIGYDALCTYALLGAPVVVFVEIANNFLKDSGTVLTLADAGRIFFLFLPVVSTLIGFSMLWIVGKWAKVRSGIAPVLVTGLVIGVTSYFTNNVENLVPLTGIACGLAVVVVMAFYLKITGKPIIDRTKLTEDEKNWARTMPLWRALMPWLLLTGIILLLNIPKANFNLLYYQWVFPLKGLMPNGSPINTRFLWNAYTWIFVSTFLAVPFLRLRRRRRASGAAHALPAHPSIQETPVKQDLPLDHDAPVILAKEDLKKEDLKSLQPKPTEDIPLSSLLKDTLQTWLKRAPRPVFAAAIFFAIGSIMQTTGYDMTTQSFQMDSMITTLANASATTFQGSYQFITTWIGLLGGIITGSEASTIAMFGRYVMESAQQLSFSREGMLLVAAALAFGGGLASVISPAKLQNAAASIDKIGQEHQVIRTAFVFAIILTAVTSLFTGLLIALGFIQ